MAHLLLSLLVLRCSVLASLAHTHASVVAAVVIVVLRVLLRLPRRLLSTTLVWNVVMTSVTLMLAKFAIIQEDLPTDFTCAFLRVTSVTLVAIKSDLASGELFATCVTHGRHQIIVLLLHLHLLVLLNLVLRWSLGHLVSRWLLLLDLLLLGLHRLHHLLLRLLLRSHCKGDVDEVELAGFDFTRLGVLLLDVAHETSLALELPLAGHALVDRAHQLLLQLLLLIVAV